MTPHQSTILLLIEEAKSQVTVGWLARRSGLPPSAVMEAGLELSHKKMVKNAGTLHTCDCGKTLKTYVYRISKRGRSMCERLKGGNNANEHTAGKEAPST